MNTATKPQAPRFPILRAATAADLMTTNPISLEDTALVSEAVILLTEHGFSAAPVIDAAGRPVGVVSRTDLLVHEREQGCSLTPADWYDEADLTRDFDKAERSGLQVQRVDATRVRDIMTPVVFSVAPNTPAAKVVAQLVALNVHRLFVVDKDEVLIGVISAVDVLRCISAD
jgi:CBS domain-containing protein